ncbi:MAG TPA: polyhydroxyalkanoate synthesis repressor PhaR [Blastocatellia bacterium]|nr:polyhydroxyalkanoate synthesis repressor PhaR [Blastocatellia bacterium]
MPQLCYSADMTRAKRSTKNKTAKDDGRILIKRYGNRRLYNTETSEYVNYQDLVKLIRDGHDVQVIDSRTKADVTKAVLMQVILEEEKTQSVLPVSFLFQLIRSRESAVQDFFKNYLSSSFEAYLKTKEEFDRRFRGFLQMSSTAPQVWEKLVPGAEAVKEFWGLNKKEEEEK